MIKAIICGFNGRMGKNVLAAINKNNNIEVACGVDITDGVYNGINVYSSFSKVTEKADVIIDFSSPKVLNDLLDYAVKNNVALVLASTGYTKEQIELIEKTSKVIPIFKTANYSIGVNVIVSLLKKASALLKDYDIEIVEAHHNQKVDAPSGTALMLADAIKETNNDLYYTYGREGVVGKRDKNEIGIHAVRGGNIVGEHEVMFIGENEIVKFSHSASSRCVFADGAVNAAIFVSGKPPKMYNMDDLIG